MGIDVEKLTDEELGEIIASRLAEVRNKSGLAQGQVAKYEKKSKSYISKLESGGNTPNVWVLLARLMHRYQGRKNISTDYVLGLIDEPLPKPDSNSMLEPQRECLDLFSQFSPFFQSVILMIMRALLTQQEVEPALDRFRLLRSLFGEFVGGKSPEELAQEIEELGFDRATSTAMANTLLNGHRGLLRRFNFKHPE